MIRLIVSGRLFMPPSADEWIRRSQSLAEGVCAIAQGKPVQTFSPASLQTGSARIALGEFFTGSTPAADRMSFVDAHQAAFRARGCRADTVSLDRLVSRLTHSTDLDTMFSPR
jgi:hypothetical protein